MEDGNIRGKPYFFVGIGGSGMMPLAMILGSRGASIAGSDRALDQARVPAKFDDLRARGVQLYPQDGSGVASPEQIVVASAAVEETVADIAAANRLGCKRMTRAELNAALFDASALPIGVAGTSGKSTVTGMIGWILHASGRDPTVMNGAVMKNFAGADTPFASALVGSGEAYVSEVDESDSSIALYSPRIAVLNNVSLDHKALDELNVLFGDFIGKAAHAVVNVDNADAATLAMRLPGERVTRFSIRGEADLVARAIDEERFGVSFDLIAGGAPIRVSLQVPGRHNVSNALAAIGATVAAGVPIAEAARAIGGFTGLRRRFDLVGEAGGVVVIDDFAHNPDKIAATLATLHAFSGRLLILFQPHGYGPLKAMRRELAETFARELSPDDRLVLPDPVYQGGTVTRDVGSGDLVRDIARAGRTAEHIPNRDAAARHLVALARPGDRIVIMGARDDTLSTLAAATVDQLEARGPYVTDTPGSRIAYHSTPGASPTVVFLPGYASDMAGTKALALEAWARENSRSFLRFDYTGCGASEGDFADQTLAGWRDDVLAMLDNVVEGEAVLVGSSMGGWLMLLAALARPERVTALVGIAPAPDFTDWGFTIDEKMRLLREGRIERPNPYGSESTLYTRGFWSSGEAHRVMGHEIAFDGPVRLLQGQRDPDVPWQRTVRLAELIGSADVRTVLVKDGDHRLSRNADIALLIGLVEEVLIAV